MNIISNEKVFGLNALLNQPGFNSIAAIAYKSDMNDYHYYLDELNNYSDNGSLIISDCRNSVSLDLEFGDDAELENSMHKLNTIIEACNEIKSFIKYAYEYNKIYKEAANKVQKLEDDDEHDNNKNKLIEEYKLRLINYKR